MRIAADWFYTVLIVSIIVVAMTAWSMRDTTSAGRTVQTEMYALLGFGVAGLLGCAILWLVRRDDLELVWQRRRTLKEARLLLKEARRGTKRYAYRIEPAHATEINEAAEALERVARARDWDKLGPALNEMDKKLDQYLGFARKSTAREYAESIGVAVLIALLLRSFVVEAFRIPSGSMIPTLQVGDHIFVNKFIYGVRVPFTDVKLGMGLRKPERGEIIVFKFPKDPDKDFIKRIVAVEGDTVEIKDNVPWVNGQPVAHARVEGGPPCEYDDKMSEDSDRWEHRQCVAYREKLGEHEFTVLHNAASGDPQHDPVEHSWSARKVPAGSVFVMGDNRDNSHDSRYWGFVPFELIKGKAMVIWWSSGQPEGIRLKRLGRLVE